jgi:hypothetical protein
MSNSYGARNSRTSSQVITREGQMRPVLFWLLGIPIPVIILLYLFHVV